MFVDTSVWSKYCTCTSSNVESDIDDDIDDNVVSVDDIVSIDVVGQISLYLPMEVKK